MELFDLTVHEKNELFHLPKAIENQIHSNKIFYITNKNRNKIFYGDGLITNEKNLALGILTADCAPIFIFDNNYNTICCLHSGWKGTLDNIVREGIKKLKNINKSNNSMTAIIGPCLAIKNFEVDKNFKLKFIRKNLSYSKFFRPKNSYKDLFDLRGLLNYQLKKEGIKNIHNIRKDTYKNSKIFFSHRRSTHQNKKEAGRMINIIALRH